jgi:hypothetical protein
MLIEKYQIFWNTLKRYNWSQIHQALDVYRKISDLLGHPEKIEQLPLTSDQRPHKKRLNSDPD